VVSQASGRPAYLQVADAIREQIQSGHYPPGSQLPTEQQLRQTWGVSVGTIRVALDQLRAEGLIVSRRGSGVFVREQTTPRRLATDVALFDGWYTALARRGLQPASTTTVTRAPAPPQAAEALGLEPGSEVTIRERFMRAEGLPVEMLATSYFPAWVIEAAPNLADPNRGGTPRWLREAFGPTWSEDVLSARMPTPAERDHLDLEPGTPVQTIAGATYDAERRCLHYIEVIAPAGRIEFAYRYGAVPPEPTEGET
jgi:GntR family transcriptional regulator